MRRVAVGEPGETGPAIERRTRRVAEQTRQMVGAEERIEAAGLHRVREVVQAIPREPFLGFDHDRDFERHGASVGFPRNIKRAGGL
jgi:hypothetical protein